MKKNSAQTCLNDGTIPRMNKQTVCFVAGKSGGHILPALTLAAHHKKTNPQDTILFFSTHSHLDTHLAGNNNNIDHYVPLTLENVPYSRLYQFPRFVWHGMRSCITSLYQLYTHKPSKIISMGGYISIPVCLAATLLRIPIELHELNAVPGKATKFLAPLATTIVVCFEQAINYFPAHKCRVAAYPHRFTKQDKQLTQADALQHIGFDNNKKTIFILGGSQGSVFINDVIKRWLAGNPDVHNTLQIIHQTGAQDTTNWHALYAGYGITAQVFTYHNDVHYYYAASDLIVCRAGAGTLWEIAFFGKRAITIPLETTTTDHQVDNARAIAQLYPELFTVLTQKEMVDVRNETTYQIINTAFGGK